MHFAILSLLVPPPKCVWGHHAGQNCVDPWRHSCTRENHMSRLEKLLELVVHVDRQSHVAWLDGLCLPGRCTVASNLHHLSHDVLQHCSHVDSSLAFHLLHSRRPDQLAPHIIAVEHQTSVFIAHVGSTTAGCLAGRNGNVRHSLLLTIFPSR